MKTHTKLGLCVLLVGALMAAAPSAQAISYDFTVDHVTGGAGTPPFGTVTLTQNGTSVGFIVHLNSGYGFVATGAGDQMDFKFNATGVSVGDITVTQNAIYPLFATQVSAPNLYNGDGTGLFAFGITGYTGKKKDGSQQNGGGNPIYTDIEFSVANSVIGDFTGSNNLGFIFAADVITPTGRTGPIAVSGPGTSVPDGGSTMILLGAAFSGLGFVARRFKK